MTILFKWENCSLWNNESSTYYYIECPNNEINNDILELMSETDKNLCLSEEFIYKNNLWAKNNPNLAYEDCTYILVSEKIDRIILEEPVFPYSPQWNSYCPLKEIKKTIKNIKEIEKFNA